MGGLEGNVRIAGYFPPDVPTIDNFPTFPLRLKSNIVKPTTPTFLSDPEAPPPTKPVVYSPVPTIRTLRGLDSGAAMIAILRARSSTQLTVFIEVITVYYATWAKSNWERGKSGVWFKRKREKSSGHVVYSYDVMKYR